MVDNVEIAAIDRRQRSLPLVAAVAARAGRRSGRWHVPGHKGQAIEPTLAAAWGDCWAWDVTELDGLDNWAAPQGAIAEAEALAASCFGAGATRFLVNGSTSGLVAAIAAVCGEGDEILVARNAHQSVLSGLMVAGATPRWVMPEVDHLWQMPTVVTPEAIARALAADPAVKAVLLVSPTYHGWVSDLGAIAALTRSHGIPLIVDAAHGAHLGLHPELPPSPLVAGADLVVVSAHKTLGSLTQSAMLHLHPAAQIDRARLEQALRWVTSSSPSYLLMASLDAARWRAAHQGRSDWGAVLARVDRVRSRLAANPDLAVLPMATGDRSRLTVHLPGWTGYEVDEVLDRDWGITAELSSPHHVTFVWTPANDEAEGDRLVAALAELTRSPQAATREAIDWPGSLAPIAPAPLTPRAASQAPAKILPIAETVGRIAAEWVCPYPPGIPVVIPGERISAEAIAQIQQAIAAGGHCTGPADYELQTLRVVAESDPIGAS
jgi:arginine/lysine/ornithine decarboxylase